jgi:hypothetical protein
MSSFILLQTEHSLPLKRIFFLGLGEPHVQDPGSVGGHAVMVKILS